MGRIDQLLANYERQVAQPLRADLPLSQRVWFLVYPPEEERRMTNRVEEFEIATKDADKAWRRIDLTGVFADWMDTFEPSEREQCLAQPDVLEAYAEDGLRDFVCARITAAFETSPSGAPEQTITALTGLMELFDFVHVSAIIEALDKTLPGVLLVFFPGDREGNTYRFLGARTGWNYLAVPILAEN